MNIQNAQNVAKNAYNNQPKPASQETQKKNTTLAADNVDKFEESNATYKSAYNKNTNKTENRRVDNDEFRSKASASARQMKNNAVRDMVSAQINAQGNKGVYKPLFGNNPIIANALKAAEATSSKHDDYWGVEATAERIFTFAKSLAGDDDSKLETMKNAFMKGFRQAEGARGGKLPGISYQTRDRVLEMFNQWENEISAKKTEKAE
ncbi:MAG: hypothetical protein LBC82_04850 [Oscillospiraceae bacterium]|jgi:hypothetical protein|nr:hypothetical protein [Oscillospiraceae bacterium]